MKVQDVMTYDPQCCAPDDDLATVAKTMWDLDCGCVPVVGDARKVLGMVTDRDLCMAAMMNGKPLHELRVLEVMSRNVVSCRPHDDLRRAQLLMRKHRVRRLPVTDREGRVAGLVSLHDLARVAEQQRRSFFPAVRLKEVAETLAEVSRPAPRPAPPALPSNVAYAE